MNVSIIANQMMVLFLMMVAGYGAYKRGMVSREGTKSLSSLIVNILNPCLILSGVMNKEVTYGPRLILENLLLVFLMFALLIALSLLFVRLGVRAPLLLIGGLCITMTLDAHLACILLAALAILAVVVVTVSRRSVPMYGQLQKALDRLVMSVRENIAGIRVIKALSKEDWEKERFAGINDQVVQRERPRA